MPTVATVAAEEPEIAANSVYIISHGSSDPTILALAKETHNYLSNGDDFYALAYGASDNYVVIDVIGEFGDDPGSGWDVAGISDGTFKLLFITSIITFSIASLLDSF